MFQGRRRWAHIASSSGHSARNSGSRRRRLGVCGFVLRETAGTAWNRNRVMCAGVPGDLRLAGRLQGSIFASRCRLRGEADETVGVRPRIVCTRMTRQSRCAQTRLSGFRLDLLRRACRRRNSGRRRALTLYTHALGRRRRLWSWCALMLACRTSREVVRLLANVLAFSVHSLPPPPEKPEVHGLGVNVPGLCPRAPRLKRWDAFIALPRRFELDTNSLPKCRLAGRHSC